MIVELEKEKRLNYRDKTVKVLRTKVCSCRSQLPIRDVIRCRQAAELDRGARFP